MPQITIIVPVYNAERTLERCVRSIQAQTVVNWELLLIDDGSEDYSSKLCDEYAIQDSRIRVFHQVNGGASSARNVGLEYTKGEWVVFCDSDDWVDSNWLELFKNQIDNGTELIVQGFIPHGNLWQSRTGINFHGNVKTGILKLQEENILGFMCTKMYKREIIEQCGLRFDTELVLREDELFMLQYAEYISTIQCMEKGAYHYDMPDFSTKYGNIDLFNMFLKIYVVLKRIFSGEDNLLLQNYENDLTQSLFHSFVMRHDDRCKKLENYRKEVGKRVLGVKSLSQFSKYILAYVPSFQVAYLLLEAKAKIVKSMQ